MEHRWQARYVYCAICSHKASKHYDKKKNLLSPTLKRNGVQKRGLQARAINVLHCICVSGYYHHHHHHYHQPPPSPPNKTKQQQQQKLALLWPYSGTFMRGSKQGKRLAGTDHAGAGEIKVCPCYTDSSIMSSKMRKSRHLRKFNGMMQN